MPTTSRFKESLKRPLQWIIVIFIILVLVGISLGPIHHGRGGEPKYFCMQACRTIGLAMFAFAQDHDGKYPTGKSSTEVFQKLIDENYIYDPGIFFSPQLQINGKTKATSKILKPENVCWDVTVPIDDKSPDDLPVIFSTGFRVEYKPEGRALPLKTNHLNGITVTYHSISAQFRIDDGQSDQIVTNFISSKFVSDGKTYQQLTPDGPLP